MFKNLVNFGYKRSGKEAVGFYITYLVVIILVSVLSAVLFGLITGSNDFSSGTKIGNIIAIIITLLLAFFILKSKNLFGNFLYLALALISGLLAFFGGGLLGLILVAYLSTRDSKVYL